MFHPSNVFEGVRFRNPTTTLRCASPHTKIPEKRVGSTVSSSSLSVGEINRPETLVGPELANPTVV